MSSGYSDEMDTTPVDKGKGKAAEDPMQTDTPSENVEEDSSDEEIADDAPIPDDEVAEDDLAEIDTNNIIYGGSRTRGKQIDYSKVPAEGLDEDDDEEDEDFQDKFAGAEGETDQEDKMEH